MSITLSNLKRDCAGSQFKIDGRATFDSSYLTGGEQITAEQLGLQVIEEVVFEDSGGYTFDSVIAAGGGNVLLKAYNGAAGTSGSTSGGTPAGTNATSLVKPKYDVDPTMITKPTIKLTHNADPVGGLAAAALFAVEASGYSISNQAFLQSNCASTASVWGETANGVSGVAASCRFAVKHNLTPAGVQIYVNEASSYRLEFVSPTATDAVIVMPFEAAVGSLPGTAVAVTIHHSATAATGKALYFDDNGAADAQLVFVDAATTDRAIPAADVVVILPTYEAQAVSGAGQAAAQVFSGSALSTHTHALSAAAGGEVTSGTNLSTLAIDFVAFGR